MAPRTGLDEPVRSRLRTARHRGLTSPEPVTASRRPSGHPPHFQTATRTSCRTRASGKASTPGSLRRSGPPAMSARNDHSHLRGGSRLKVPFADCPCTSSKVLIRSAHIWPFCTGLLRPTNLDTPAHTRRSALKMLTLARGRQALSVTGACRLDCCPMTGPAARPYDRASVGVRHWYRRPAGGRMLAGCPWHAGHRHAPMPGGGCWIRRGAGPAAGADQAGGGGGA